MTTEDYGKIIQKLKKGYVDEALLMLDQILDNNTSKEARDFTLLYSRYNSLKRKQTSGVTSYQEFNLESNKILGAIILFIQEKMASMEQVIDTEKVKPNNKGRSGNLKNRGIPKHKNQLVIIEDDYENAQFYAELLKLEQTFTEVVYTKELEQVKQLMKKDRGTRVFIVDINLDANREANRSGLGIVEYIKSRNSKSLVIVYSGHGTYRDVAKKIGANAFYEKGERGAIEDDFKVIRSFIIESLEAIGGAKKMDDKHKNIDQKVLEENKVLLEQLNNSWKVTDSEYRDLVNLQMEIVARLSELRRERTTTSATDPLKVEAILREIGDLKQAKTHNEDELEEIELRRLNIDKARKAILIN